MPKRIVHSKKPERVSIETDIETRQKLKMVASIHGMTMMDWLQWSVARAYESMFRNKKK